jgi:hypothetical protein
MRKTILEVCTIWKGYHKDVEKSYRNLNEPVKATEKYSAILNEVQLKNEEV